MRVLEVVDSVLKVIRQWPTGAKQEFGAILLRLQKNDFVGMPDTPKRNRDSKTKA